MLALRAGQWWLEDRESRNGTLLNGERLHGPAVVSAGDIIGIGEIELRLELE
jgi:pSer/pThr/pTyr-binding forkhead associated (FHA) protein